MGIEIVPEYTDIQKTSLDETGWTGFNTPHSSNVGQTYGPAGMGIGAYMNRPETKPGFVPFKIPKPGYESNVGTSMQTDGPAGMGMRPYMNRPETQPGFTPFMSPSNFRKQVSHGIPAANQGYKVMNASGLGDTIKNWFKYGFGDPENQWKGNSYELDEFEFNLLHPRVDFESVLPEERTIDTEGEEYRRLQELLGIKASGDSYNIMAGELMRSGLFDPVEIQNMDSYELQQNYENTFGSTGDAMQMSLNLQDVMDLHKLKGLDLNTDRFIKRANKANVQVTNRGGIIGLI